ncbi:MAG: 1-acyl-sn-glycerol-3-phosphate acyltransferase [Gammaproteobacteria bacterium]|nr:1-acyl-sn-glycerol-3-phosphate acyltransferase [Gammaproteobacteria bacterium]HJL96369.1 lysophospholipid acyltransferase family protein [SAR86 cluster bacterium]HJM59363.1 lysophospholipid acyltransferase family protein [SAR86 cluster bacterium]|tara:strand:+ start:421 stop:1119 length:699 start_codon:yes stop_codon:yes gene_type:complete
MLYLRSGIFYIGYIGSGILASFLACVIGPFLPLNRRLKFFSLWPRFANWFLYQTCKVELVIEGEENLPEEPCVIVSNHQGQWETFSMQYLFYPLCTLLKKELLLIPLWGWAMSLLKPIAINRSKPKEAILQTLNEGSERLASGLYVLLFPEGTRVEAGGVGNYARSSFELAKRNNVKVLPVCHNSGDCWPAHKFKKYPGVIKLTIGNPLEVRDSKESAKNIQVWTENTLKRN